MVFNKTDTTINLLTLKKYVQYLLALSILGWALSSGLVYSKSTVDEGQIKSAFLIKILNYVRWPEERSSGVSQICVYADNPFDNFLEKFARLSTLEKKKPVKIKYLTKLDELKGCHIVYLTLSSKDKLPELLKVAKENSILTVSDIDNFHVNGGMVEFVSKNNRIKLHINYNSKSGNKGC